MCFQPQDIRIFLTISLIAILAQVTPAQAIQDGTLMGIEVAPRSFFDATPTDFHDLNGKAIFTASSQVIWVSDGHEENTIKIEFEGWDEVDLYADRVAALDSLFYFPVQDAEGNWNIWATNGTHEGTREIANGAQAGFFNIRSMTTYGRRVAFISYVAEQQKDRLFLINEDGSGATMVDGVSRVYNGGTPPRMVDLNNTLYITESDGQERILKRVSEEGTVSEAWRMPDAKGTQNKSIHGLAVAGSRIFFTGNDGDGLALWAYHDGSGSRMFSPDPDDEENFRVANLTAVGELAYFFSRPWNEDVNDFSNNYQLYVTDGTPGGTHRIWKEELGDGPDAHNALNTPTVVAGDRFLFVVDYSWYSAQGNSASIQPVEAGGKAFGHASSLSDPVNVKNGVWLATNSDLAFIGATSEESFIVGPEDMVYMRSLGAVDDMPWFAARISGRLNSTVWRVGIEAAAAPVKVASTSPEAGQTDVDLLPDFAWTETDPADFYHLQVSTGDSFSELIVDTASIAGTTFTLEEPLEENTKYWYRVRAENETASGEWSDALSFTTKTLTGLNTDDALPVRVALDQNYPNPFNPATVIGYQLPEQSQVHLAVYDLLGRRVAVLVAGEVAAGRHQVRFEAGELASGIYVYRLRAGEKVINRKLMFVR